MYLVIYITYITIAVAVVISLLGSARKLRESAWRRALPLGAIIGTGWPVGWVIYGLMEVKVAEMGGIYWVGGAFMVPLFYAVTVVVVTTMGSFILRSRRKE